LEDAVGIDVILVRHDKLSQPDSNLMRASIVFGFLGMESVHQIVGVGIVGLAILIFTTSQIRDVAELGDLIIRSRAPSNYARGFPGFERWRICLRGISIGQDFTRGADS
jgi:hypothetical protein